MDMRLVTVVLVIASFSCGARTGLNDGTSLDAGAEAAEENGVNAVAVGNDHACALLRDHTLRCWGYNSSGQVGNGKSDGEDVRSATPVVGLDGTVKKVSAGGAHTCAVKENGDLFCWGRGAEGQIGDGAGRARIFPTLVIGGVIDVVASENYTCAVMLTHRVKCWGNNDEGNLGDGTTISRLVPVDVVGVTRAVAVAAGYSTTFALLDDGTVMHWGNVVDTLENDSGMERLLTPTLFTPLEGVRELANRCALLVSGRVVCWGGNVFGEVGDGTTTPRRTPVELDLGETATHVTSGITHRCVTLQSGVIRCWGQNWYGALGDGTTIDRHLPTPVIGVTGVVTASAGGSTCAVADDSHDAKCWGNNIGGELGNGTNISSPFATTVLGLR